MRVTDREREKDRQTDRQRDRQTERDREIESQRNKERDITLYISAAVSVNHFPLLKSFHE